MAANNEGYVNVNYMLQNIYCDVYIRNLGHSKKRI